MSDWDERNIDQAESDASGSAPVTRESDGLPGWLLGVAASLALIAGLGIYWLFSDKSPVTVSEPPPAAPPARVESTPVEPAEPSKTEAPDIALPALSESDSYVRDALSRLSRHPAIVSLLMTDELVRKLVTAVVNVAEGDNAARHFPLLAPNEPYEVVRRPPRIFVDPRGYHRYDALAEGFASLDAEGLAAAYRESKPLFEEAYRELGYLHEPFEATLLKALNVLLSAPVVEGRIALEAESVNYTYADRRLEALSPAQKQLLRMGPANTRRIQSKLRQLAGALELPAK